MSSNTKIIVYTGAACLLTAGLFALAGAETETETQYLAQSTQTTSKRRPAAQRLQPPQPVGDRVEGSDSQSRVSATKNGRSYTWDPKHADLVAQMHEANRGSLDEDAVAKAIRELAVADPLRFESETRTLGPHPLLIDAFPATVNIPHGSQANEWLAAVVFHEGWARVSDLDVTGAVPSRNLAQALCMAGRRDEAVSMYREVVVQNPRATSMAFACGLPAGELPVARRGDRFLPDIAAGLAKEDRDALAAFTEVKRNLHLGAALYLDGTLSSEEFVKAGGRGGRCSAQYDPQPSPPPKLLLDAARKLSKTARLDKKGVALVSNLRRAAVVAGAARNQDLRKHLPREVERREPCLAVLGSRWDPHSAIDQLAAQLDAKKHGDGKSTRRNLARAYIRTGDLTRARAMLNDIYPSHSNWEWTSDDIVLYAAISHLEGNLGQVTQNYRDKGSFRRVLTALRGSDEDRRALRMDAPGHGLSNTVEGLILLGALAPGNEERFLDTLLNQHSGFAQQMWMRAEAARWRGDDAAASKWSQRLDRLIERVGDGRNGGLYAIVVPDRLR